MCVIKAALVYCSWDQVCAATVCLLDCECNPGDSSRLFSLLHISLNCFVFTDTVLRCIFVSFGGSAGDWQAVNGNINVHHTGQSFTGWALLLGNSSPLICVLLKPHCWIWQPLKQAICDGECFLLRPSCICFLWPIISSPTSSFKKSLVESVAFIS